MTKLRKAERQAMLRTPVNSGAVYIPPALAERMIRKGLAERARNVASFVGEIPVFWTEAGRAALAASVTCMCGAVDPKMIEGDDALPRCERCGCH